MYGLSVCVCFPWQRFGWSANKSTLGVDMLDGPPVDGLLLFFVVCEPRSIHLTGQTLLGYTPHNLYEKELFDIKSSYKTTEKPELCERLRICDGG